MKFRCIPMMLAAATAAGFLFTSCADTPDYQGRQRPYVPRVAVPPMEELNEYERQRLPEVEDYLTDAGYRITTAGSAEFRLEFSIESGPVNTDTTLALLRGNSEVARSSARQRSALSVVQRSRVVDQSFKKCLDDFHTRLPRGGAYYGGSQHPQSQYPQDYPQQRPDWQSGWQE